MANKYLLQIDPIRCVKCQHCSIVCPQSVIRKRLHDVPLIARPQKCIVCGHCVDVCDVQAFSHSAFPATAIHPVNPDLLPSPSHLRHLMATRRSNRTVSPRPIPEEKMEKIVDAAYLAPTAENSRLVKVTRLQGDQIRALEDAAMKLFVRLSNILMSPILRPLTRLFLRDLYEEAPELERFRRAWKKGKRPCTCHSTQVLVFSTPKGYRFRKEDCNLAYQNASLMAECLGVSQVYLGLVSVALSMMSKEKQARLFHLPKGHQMGAIMGLGLPAIKFSFYTDKPVEP